MNRWLYSLAIVLPALLVAHEAAAVRNPDYLSERPLETAKGARGRLVRPVEYQPRPAAAASWQRFLAAHGSWTAVWDADTGVPLRIAGEGLAVPGANASPVIAEAAARALLEEQLALIAPGSKLGDWQLVANVVHGKGDTMRTVGFAQHHDGLLVQHGEVSFLFKRDRLFVIGSQAVPSVTAPKPAHIVTGTEATAKAIAWITTDYQARPTLLAEGGVSILPIIRERGDDGPVIEYRVVKTITLDLDSPRAQWDVYVDAETGQPVARHQRLMFGAGTLKYNTPVRYPAIMRQDFVVPFANITIGASSLTTDVNGGFSYNGAGPASVFASVTGPRARVSSNGGNGATSLISIPDAGSGVWTGASTPTLDAQLTAFVHVNRIKAFAKAELNPNLSWIDRQIDVTVNIPQTCNAYAGYNELNFFVSGQGCENTGRLPDVVYHEFGHALHFNSIIPGAGASDSSLSEGVSDYLAATTVEDSGMGRGFFAGSSQPLREIDPPVGETTWPRDISPDPHATGLIIAGALWDLRKAMIEEYGAVDGKRRADDLYYAILQRAADIPSTYVEVIAADDDDGNLSNGTPHQCMIAAAFNAHGLLDPQSMLGIGLVTRDGLSFAFDVTTPALDCPLASVRQAYIEWRVQGVSSTTPTTFSRTGDRFAATIPAQPDGTVLQYRVTIVLENGLQLIYPVNPADPFYQLYVGPTETLYCTDFESDPFAAGWTHSASTGSDDWEWGAPTGEAGELDPPSAASGTKAVGQDLGIGSNRDGRYRDNSFETLTSPVVDTTGKTGVHLQYKRWLSVEDGNFDQAQLLVDGGTVWSNAAAANTQLPVDHIDREWRFHDVALDAQAADGSVQVAFQLAADGGGSYGGWAIDDFCIVAQRTGPALPVCGNDAIETGETCDDGNTTSGDGCSATCVDETAPGEDGGGCCSTGADPTGALLLGVGSVLLVLRRRRRAARA